MKFFAISDIHNAYTPMKKSLNDAGFELGNPEHLLIVCGDYFDRMNESQQVLDYLMSVPNKVLIKGNHELLIEEFIQRKYPLSHDWSNSTAKTLMDLAPNSKNWEVVCSIVMEKLHPLFNQMVNYFETEHYIFVHGWIPVNYEDKFPTYYRNHRHFSAMKNFRMANQKQWDDAIWLCGPDMALNGYNNTGKTIVFGHWHNSYLWSIKDGYSEFGNDAKFDIFYGKDFIGLDSCVAHSGKLNCLVIEDNFV